MKSKCEKNRGACQKTRPQAKGRPRSVGAGLPPTCTRRWPIGAHCSSASLCLERFRPHAFIKTSVPPAQHAASRQAPSLLATPFPQSLTNALRPLERILAIGAAVAEDCDVVKSLWSGGNGDGSRSCPALRADFLREHWERKPLLSRPGAAWAQSLMGLGDIRKMVGSWPIRFFKNHATVYCTSPTRASLPTFAGSAGARCRRTSWRWRCARSGRW